MLSLDDFPRGSVIAPAGCGKTQSIVSLVKNSYAKPLLILTHTNAGVFSLNTRLLSENISSKVYRLYTLDAWSQRIVRAFPRRSEYEIEALTSPNFIQIKRAALRVLLSGVVDEIISASYSGLLVDEYQDCDAMQHSLIIEISKHIPVRIFGDPMQAIFDFKGNERVPWSQVTQSFLPIESLRTPWRWKKANCTKLGEWLLDIHSQFSESSKLDLSYAPVDYVKWISRDRETDIEAEKKALKSIDRSNSDRLIIIGHTKVDDMRYGFARRNPGVSVIERADLPQLDDIAARLAIGSVDNQLKLAIEFSESVMTGTRSADLIKRIEVIRKGKERKKAESHEINALNFLDNPSPSSLGRFIASLINKKNTRTFRFELGYALIDALEMAKDFSDLPQKASVIRDRHRFSGRVFPRSAIGTTLLVKGLEADHVLILDGDALETIQHLYVAMTRGARTLTIISRETIITPSLREDETQGTLFPI